MAIMTIYREKLYMNFPMELLSWLNLFLKMIHYFDKYCGYGKFPKISNTLFHTLLA